MSCARQRRCTVAPSAGTGTPSFWRITMTSPTEVSTWHSQWLPWNTRVFMRPGRAQAPASANRIFSGRTITAPCGTGCPSMAMWASPMRARTSPS